MRVWFLLCSVSIGVYKAPIFVYVAPVGVYKAPIFVYVAPIGVYKAPIFVYVAPIGVYKAPIFVYVAPVGVYKVAIFVYEAPIGVYKVAIFVYVVPVGVYKVAIFVYVAPIFGNVFSIQYLTHPFPLPRRGTFRACLSHYVYLGVFIQIQPFALVAPFVCLWGFDEAEAAASPAAVGAVIDSLVGG